MAIPIIDNPWTLAYFLMSIFSLSYFLYRDNPTYTFAEHILVGIAAGNVLVLSLTNVYSIVFSNVQNGNYIYIIPAIIGILLFTRLTKTYGYLARLPIAFVSGVGLGLGVRGTIGMDLLGNIRYMAFNLLGGKTTPIDNILVTIFTVTSIYYFVYARGGGGKSGENIIARIGIYAIMITFGGQFANGILSRLSWLGGVIITLLQLLGLT